jgi:microcystin-dependent protein
MAEPFIGEVKMVGFNFAPRGWAFCDGSLLPISQYEALFSLIGTTYGGDGQTTFALPDLRSRAPIHQGNGHPLGEIGGTETVTLTVNQIPAHSHVPQASSAGATTGPAASVWANSAALQFAPASSPLTAMNQGVMAAAGGGQPQDNMPPYLAINFAIALEGIYPTQS